jgi:hypothetical protein
LFLFDECLEACKTLTPLHLQYNDTKRLALPQRQIKIQAKVTAGGCCRPPNA